MKNSPSPPLWIQRFFRWYCNQSHQEHVEGDLFELFERNVKTYGLRQAKWRYFRQVMDLIRPFTLRRTTPSYTPLIYSDMFFHQFRTVLRNLRRNAAFTLINVSGLTLGMLVALIIFLKIGHDLNFDRHLKDANLIFRIVSDADNSYHAGIPGPIPALLQTHFPEIEAMAVVDRNFQLAVLTITDEKGQKKQFKEDQAAMVWPEYFDVFSYNWISGNPKTALAEPHTAVIARSLADKFYGTEDAIGKSFTLNNETEIRITGVYDDPPLSTNFPYQLLISKADDRIPDWLLPQWHAFAESFQLFVKINPNTDLNSLHTRMGGILKAVAPKEEEVSYSLRLQPVPEMHLDTRYYSSGKSAIATTTLWALMLIAVFLLVSACINFVNLNTSLIFQRAKEVGLRKVLGSGGGHIFRFFMLETGVLVLLAFFISIALMPIVLKQATFIIGEALSISLIREMNLFPWLLVFFVLVCLLAGLYPALLMSGINPVLALKNKVEKSYARGLTLRKGLMVLQFSLTHMLIICMLVAMQQMRFFHNAPLGFDQTALVEIDMPAEDIQQLRRMKTVLTQEPSIQSVCFSNNGAASDGYWQYNYAYFPPDTQEAAIRGNANIKMVDNDYIHTYGIELLAGESFAVWDSLPTVIINETLLNQIGMHTGSEALGENLTVGVKKYKIQGVIKDFHTQSLHASIMPTVLIPDVSNTTLGGIKIQGGNLTETIAYIQATWEAAFPDNIFEYHFLDEKIAAFYESEKRITRLFQVASLIAICIGALGLFGLISMIAAQRSKEIGIRKVLGASVGNILALFTTDFGWLILIGFVIAAPLAAWAMQSWLEDFAYRIPLQAGVFVLAFIASVGVMFISIGWKTFRVASMNPVDAIRDE
ncbi:MAG: ABC transporter permease [Bacteroidia bacterium]|nr:ABC transporter permease [Bacteroidia bacterium]